VRLGAQGLDAGTSGAFFLDDFESRRISAIGVLPEPGIPDPQPVEQAYWNAKGYTYGQNGAGPHAVTALSNGDSFTYDANGNMLTRVVDGETITFTYNAENRVASATRGETSIAYLYDGDGTRVGQVVNLTQAAFYFMGGQYEVTYDLATQSQTAMRKYYAIAGQMIAMDDGSGSLLQG
jgi:YD repeat-containing protein